MGQGILSGFLRDPFQLIAMLIGPQSMPKIFIYIIDFYSKYLLKPNF